MAENVKYTISLNDELSPKVEQAEKKVIGLDNAVRQTNLSLKSMAGVAAAAFAAFSIVEFTKNIISAGTQVEDARIGLTTLLKDEAAATQVIQNTMEDAAKTPFDFSNLLNLNKLLIGAQVPAEKARQDVLALANAVAATGGGNDELSRMAVNLQQIKNVGQATSVDIKQFAMAGINIYKVLADATGKTTEEVKDLTVSYDLLTYALQKASQDGGAYAGGLEAMANSTSVKISNLGDSIFNLSVRIYNDLKPAIMSVLEAVSSFIGVLSSAYEWVKENIDVIGILAAGILTYTVYINASAIATSIAATATSILTAAQRALNAAMNANPIGVVILALTALAAGIAYAWKHFAGFRGAVMGAWEVLKGLVGFVKDFVIGTFTGLANVIAGVFTLDPDQIQKGLDQAVSAYSNFGKQAATAFNKGYSKGLDSFAATQVAEKDTVKSLAGAPTKTPVPPFDTKAPKGTGTATSGQKVTTINIDINKLIEKFEVHTTNMTESAEKIKEMVTRVLINSVNDAQLTGGN